MGKTFNQHYLFGSKHSDCCILLPVTLLHTVICFSFGNRFFLMHCAAFTLCSAHLMWQYEGQDELQACVTMNEIACNVLGTGTPPTLFIGMDANISVLPTTAPPDLNILVFREVASQVKTSLSKKNMSKLMLSGFCFGVIHWISNWPAHLG